MQHYLVIGSDGQEYGPVDAATLQSWVKETRVTPDTELRDPATRRSVKAAAIPGLFESNGAVATMPPPSMPQTPPSFSSAYGAPNSSGGNQPYPRNYAPQQSGTALWKVLGMSLAAVALAFVLRFYPLLLSIYAIREANYNREADDKHGVLMMVIAIASVFGVIAVEGIRILMVNR